MREIDTAITALLDRHPIERTIDQLILDMNVDEGLRDLAGFARYVYRTTNIGQKIHAGATIGMAAGEGIYRGRKAWKESRHLPKKERLLRTAGSTAFGVVSGGLTGDTLGSLSGGLANYIAKYRRK